jgi:hypothetical protein
MKLSSGKLQFWECPAGACWNILSLAQAVCECISTDQLDKDQCSKHQRSADQRLSTSTKID